MRKTRNPSSAAGIEVIDDSLEGVADDLRHETNGHRTGSKATAAKTVRKSKPTAHHDSSGSVGVGEIKKAAAFAKSVGGLDKAIGLLQILKVQ